MDPSLLSRAFAGYFVPGPISIKGWKMSFLSLAGQSFSFKICLMNLVWNLKYPQFLGDDAHAVEKNYFYSVDNHIILS